MDDICFKAPLYASDILFELKHKAGMDLELINKIQRYSKSLFHKLAYENTSIQTMQNLMMILADYNTNCHKKSVSKKIIKTLDEIISIYYKKDSELNELMKTHYLNGEKGKIIEVRDEIKELKTITFKTKYGKIFDAFNL